MAHTHRRHTLGFIDSYWLAGTLHHNLLHRLPHLSRINHRLHTLQRRRHRPCLHRVLGRSSTSRSVAGCWAPVVPPWRCLNADISTASALSSHSTTTLPLPANGAREPSIAAKTAPPLCHSGASSPCCICSNILLVPISLNIVIYCQISLPRICPYTFDYCIEIGGHLFRWSN